MYLALNDEQRLLAQTIRSFMQKEAPPSKVREVVATQDAFDEELWRKMAEQGWMSLTVPTEFGGMADSWLTVAVLFEESGWGLAPGPFLATVGLAAPLLTIAGSAQQKSRWLPAIAEGNCRASVAYLEVDGGYEFDSTQTTASETDGSYTLSGIKMFALDAGVADVVIVAAKEADALGLFLVERGATGMTIEPLEGMDVSRRLTRVILDETPAKKMDACPDAHQALEYALDAASLALSAEGVGGMQWILDTAVAYA
jgi:acyl-CoA dehydrogenase